MNLSSLLPTRHQHRDVIGIDVGRRAVKAVRRDRGRIVARNLVPWDCPTDFEDDDRHGRLAQAVERATATFGLRHRHRAIAVLSLSFGTLRGFELPPASDAETLEMIRQEFATDPRLDPSRAEVACWAAPTRGELRSVCGWALEHTVSRYVHRELGRAGLDCASIEALPFALARATAGLGGTIAANPTAVVDWGARCPSLTIAHRGRPTYTRSLRDCGHEHVVERLSEGLGLSGDEAWEFFDGFAPGSGTAPELSQLLAEYARDVGEGIVDEIERTIGFLGERMPTQVPRSILLFGGGAELLRAPLREAFGSRVVTWAESVRETGPSLASAHGAATSSSWEVVA